MRTPCAPSPDDRRNVFFARRGRLDVHDHVGIRQDGLDRVLGPVGDVVRPLESLAARDGDRQVGENLRAAAAQSGAKNALDAGHAARRRNDFFVQPARHAVEQVVHRFFTEPEADPNDNGGDNQGCGGVGVDESGHVEPRARQHAA